MIIGFDASRAFVAQRTGTENYSFQLLKQLLVLDKKNVYKVYLRLPLGIDSSRDSVKQWLAQIQESLPKTQNYHLIVIRNKHLWTQAGLAWEIWQRPPNVLFIPAHTLPFIRKGSIKTVVTIHDLGFEYLPQYHQFPQRLWLNRTTEYAVKNADRLISVSEATKEDLIRKLHANAEKISVIYEGMGLSVDPASLSTQSVDYAKNKFSIPSPYVIFVGTIQPRKNLVRLIQAFALLISRESIAEQYPSLRLVLIGRKGWLYSGIYSEPARLGIADRVMFLGHVPDADTAALVKGALCFAFPSLFEGFGIPILDSQAYGTPVVTSHIKPMTEVGGGACEYVDQLSVESIAHGIEHILLDRKYADALRLRGFKNITRFSWVKAARESLAVIES
jgi:glycosyltransferase involved in cell wall biosynthesis